MAARERHEAIRGCLRVLARNPRYFTDDGRRAISFAASHTWNNLLDMGHRDPPEPFDFDAYLDRLELWGHNFIRLWTIEAPRFLPRAGDKMIYVSPLPWPRSGPGDALDGRPRFDLQRFDPEYFGRLRERTEKASRRGIWVSVMLFEGWGIHFSEPPHDWQYHPFNHRNNINGIEADRNLDGHGREYHTLESPEVTAIQEAYVRNVIDTVNDLDNVLYEISNESSMLYSTAWQYHLVGFIKRYEAGKPKQHPVGMTGYGPAENNLLYSGPADWISPGAMTKWKNSTDPFMRDPPAADGLKVCILDTDHIWGMGGDRDWVWKSFLRGYSPIFMDPSPLGKPEDCIFSLDPYSPEMLPKLRNTRLNLGYTRQYATRMNLARMAPRNDLCMSTFCLADPGREYLCYLPRGGTTAVDLSEAPPQMLAEWFDPSRGTVAKTQSVRGGGIRMLHTPFRGDAVLYVRRVPPKARRVRG